MKYCWLILSVILLSNCTTRERPKLHKQVAFADWATSITHYFPANHPLKSVDSMTLSRMANYLALLEEKPLHDEAQGGPALRFIYESLFNKHFIVVRIDAQQIVIKKARQFQSCFATDEDSSMLSAEERKQLNTYKAYYEHKKVVSPDTVTFLQAYPWLRNNDYVSRLQMKLWVPGSKLIAYTIRTLPTEKNTIEALMAQADSFGFWNLLYTAAIGFDGCFWRLEATVKGRHHFVDRWSPKDGPYYDLCKRITQYAQLQEHETY